MKKTISFIAGLLLALTGMAQENKGGISGFMKEELEDFDKFMDDADKDFINFMREPWKEFEAEKPVLKRVKPEPVKPVVYDEKTAPKSEKPVCLSRLSRPNRKQNLLLLLKQTDVRSRRQNPGYRSPQLQRPHCTGANRDAAR